VPDDYIPWLGDIDRRYDDDVEFSDESDWDDDEDA